MDVTQLSPYQLGLALGEEYAEAALDYDAADFWDYPKGAAEEAFRDDVPPASRDWYFYEFHEYRQDDWDEFDDGFSDGVDRFVEMI